MRFGGGNRKEKGRGEGKEVFLFSFYLIIKEKWVERLRKVVELA